jgi:hypothetical protein
MSTPLAFLVASSASLDTMISVADARQSLDTRLLGMCIERIVFLSVMCGQRNGFLLVPTVPSPIFGKWMFVS